MNNLISIDDISIISNYSENEKGNRMKKRSRFIEIINKSKSETLLSFKSLSIISISQINLHKSD
jgi:hypothetical protein